MLVRRLLSPPVIVGALLVGNGPYIILQNTHVCLECGYETVIIRYGGAEFTGHIGHFPAFIP